MQNAVPSNAILSRPHAAAPWRGEGLRVAALAGALMLLGYVGSGLRPQVRPMGAVAREQEGGAWEARRMLAQLYWLKTHAVMHAGAEERAARPGEEESRKGEFHSHGGAEEKKDEHEEHGDHEGHENCPDAGSGAGTGSVLVIPPAREDFRGVLGDLERSVKPYAARDGKLYSKDVDQTLPYYQLVTWVDPHHIEAYTVGATMICRAGKYPDQAIKFLQDGERSNPRSFEIQTELGRFFLVYKRDYPSAERHLQRAISLIPQGVKLTELQEDERNDAYRWLALTYREWAKPDQARLIARAGLQIIGDDVSLQAILKDARPAGITLHPRKLATDH